ncbi:uncharacterized protein KQ657_000992 [Scheffersomyces spartinae]|uniref:Uncharacterized protein n=1 Tax=Scheffersomyces spartinae TaxID=45513 RepID=A0A9P8AI02_9ASCO|nr:uncharacterized protein KQ657_000992 [Scheffersomyces spartinae]KAG7193230.1 hypothetical protein KQ657_000992 [Scheffersomyces spartinae]
MEPETAKGKRRDTLVHTLHNAKHKQCKDDERQLIKTITVPCSRTLSCPLERLALESELSHKYNQLQRQKFYYKWGVWSSGDLSKPDTVLETPNDFKQLMWDLKKNLWTRLTVFRLPLIPLRRHYLGGSTLEFKYTNYHTAIEAFKLVAEAILTNKIYDMPQGFIGILGITLKQLTPSLYSIIRIWCTDSKNVASLAKSVALGLSCSLENEWDDCVQVNNLDNTQLRLV